MTKKELLKGLEWLRNQGTGQIDKVLVGPMANIIINADEVEYNQITSDKYLYLRADEQVGAVSQIKLGNLKDYEISRVYKHYTTIGEYKIILKSDKKEFTIINTVYDE